MSTTIRASTLWCIAALTAVPCLSDEAAERVTRVVEGTWALATEEAKTSRGIDSPYYYYNREMKLLVYGLGTLRPDRMGLAEDEPMECAMIHAINAKTIEGVLQHGAGKEAFWQEPVAAYRAAIDKLISDAVRNDGKGAKALRAQVEDSLAGIDRAVKRHAKEMGYGIGEQSRAPATGLIETELRTEPTGGTLRIMTKLRYEKCRLLELPEDRMPWVTVATPRSRLCGRYEFRASWPGGKQAKGVFEVKNDKILIRPDGAQ